MRSLLLLLLLLLLSLLLLLQFHLRVELTDGHVVRWRMTCFKYAHAIGRADDLDAIVDHPDFIFTFHKHSRPWIVPDTFLLPFFSRRNNCRCCPCIRCCRCSIPSNYGTPCTL